MTKKQRQEYETLKKDVRALSQHPNMSPIVLEIMKDWIKIREFQFPRISKFAFSNFRSIHPKEFDYIARLVNKFITQFENDPEFEQAFVAQTRNFDRRAYRSVRLAGKKKGHMLVFPYMIFMEERLNSSSSRILSEIIHTLNKNPSYRNLPEFIDLVISCRTTQRIRLSALAVDYLKCLTDLRFATPVHGFPSQQDIVQRLGCTDRSVSKLQNFFTYLEVVTSRYLVNYARLGFAGFQLLHKKALPAAFRPFTLRTYLIGRNTYLSIVYLPPNSALVEDFPPGKVSELVKYSFSRNLEQLHHKKEDSFKFPVRFTQAAMMDRTPGEWGVTFDLAERKVASSYSLTDLKLLDQLIVTVSSYHDLALSIGIAESYLIDRFTRLLHEKVITPFYSISRIGLTGKIVVIFEGTASEIRKITAGLLHFPHVELFLTQGDGAAALRVPPHWIPPLYEDIIALREELNIYGLLYHSILSRWGIPLAEQAQKRISA
ncbi:MAG: hypothetical protein ACE5OZ_08030 [Candidatus Heimdallarchaeota archaeon]